MNRTSQRGVAVRAAVVCAGLIAWFGTIAWLAVSTKSPTFDEPMHALAGHVIVHHGDHRLDPENPVLLSYWTAPAYLMTPLAVPMDGPEWRRALTDPASKLTLLLQTFFGTPGNDIETLITRARAMALASAVALGTVIAFWAWRIAGATAAVVATAVFAVDPNFLAHGPILKSDVLVTMLLAAALLCTWLVGRRLTLMRVILLTGGCGLVVCAKFSGLIAGPIIAFLLTARALAAEPWRVGARVLDTRWKRLGAAVAISVICLLVSYVMLWAAYGFRFSVSPNPADRPNMREIVDRLAKRQIVEARGGDTSAPVDINGWRPGIAWRALLLAHEHKLLPEPYIVGMFVIRSATVEPTRGYLLGEVRAGGWWYYFLLAMLFKTPVVTLVLIAAAVVLLAMVLRDRSFDRRWGLACLLMPVVLYLASTTISTMNLGLRHVLPVYPPLMVLIGWAAAISIQRWGRRAGQVAAGLLFLTAVESLRVFPDFIPFFNVAAGGARGGVHLLGDSNLDWGQDLKTLAAWQAESPDRNQLYLAYFGTVLPAAYGVNHVPIASGFAIDRNVVPTQPGYLAISATVLQGIHLPAEHRAILAPLLDAEPDDVLGGSIYIFAPNQWADVRHRLVEFTRTRGN